MRPKTVKYFGIYGKLAMYGRITAGGDLLTYHPDCAEVNLNPCYCDFKLAHC